MRIRQVKPSFWTDAKLSALPHDARLFYIGLWMLADDDGWLVWDVAEIGAELYGFEGRTAREKRIERMAVAIRAMPGDEKLKVYDCNHAELPRLAVHQHLAGTTRRVTAVHDKHSRDCSRLPATPRESPPRIGKVSVSDSEGVGVGSRALPRDAGRTVSIEDERNERIARSLAVLNDPKASEARREIARSEINRLGGRVA